MNQNFRSTGSDRHTTRTFAWMKIHICVLVLVKRFLSSERADGVTVILKEKNKQTDFKN